MTKWENKSRGLGGIFLTSWLNVFAVFGLDRKQTNSHFVLPFGAAISGSHSVSQPASQPVA